MLSDTDVLAAVNAERFPDGQLVTLEAIFGNSITFDESGKIAGARAMMQVCVCVSVSMFYWFVFLCQRARPPIHTYMHRHNACTISTSYCEKFTTFLHPSQATFFKA